MRGLLSAVYRVSLHTVVQAEAGTTREEGPTKASGREPYSSLETSVNELGDIYKNDIPLRS